MPEVELNLVAGGEPVCAPSSLALSAASQPTAYQVSFVHIRTARVTAVNVKAPSTTYEIHWRCSSSLNTKVKLGNTRNPWYVDPPLNRGFTRVGERGRFVFSECISVERKPVAQTGNPVRKVDSGPRIRYIRSDTSGSESGIALYQIVPIERSRSTSEYCRFANTEFKVGGRFETEFFSVEERLAAQGTTELAYYTRSVVEDKIF